MSRYDVVVNTTLEIDDDVAETILSEYRDSMDIDEGDDVSIEDALEWAIEQDPPQNLELGLHGGTWFVVAAERVTYLDG